MNPFIVQIHKSTRRAVCIECLISKALSDNEFGCVSVAIDEIDFLSRLQQNERFACQIAMRDQTGRAQPRGEAELGNNILPGRNEFVTSGGLLHDAGGEEVDDVNAAQFIRLTVLHLLNESIQRRQTDAVGRFQQGMSVRRWKKAEAHDRYENG